MKSQQEIADLLRLWRNVYLDVCDECSVVPDLRDYREVEARVIKEGVSFLTITLPAFCKDLERSLALGRIDSNAFQGFAKAGPKARAIPAFLQGMLSHLFDRVTDRKSVV